MKQSYLNFKKFKGGPTNQQDEYMDPEQIKGLQEIAPTFQYLNYNDNIEEEFEEKLYELVKDNTDDHFLLLEVLSGVGVLGEKEVDKFRMSTRFQKVDTIVREHLKSNKFTPE